MPKITKAFFVGRYLGFLSMLITNIVDTGFLGSVAISVAICAIGVALVCYFIGE